MGEAASTAGRLIEKCVDHAVASLQAAEAADAGTDQRQQLSGAWRELLVRRKTWSVRLPQLLGAAFEVEARGAPRAQAASEDRTIGSLSLVDDVEIARTIESARLAQQLGAAVERPLAELDALMSSALELEGVQPERNPLRPAVYAQVLRRLVDESPAEPAWPGLWLRAMGAPLAEELAQLYRDQVHFLTLARVHAANYRLVSAPSRPVAAAGSPPAAPPATAATRSTAAAGDAAPARAGHSGFAELAPQSIDGPRLREFLLRDPPDARRPLGPSYYAQVDAELRAIEARQDERSYDADAAREHMRVPAVDRPQRRVDTASPLPREIWGEYSGSRERSLLRGRLKTQAREVGQVFGLEVVRALVDQVAEDPRLLAPMREAIVGLEPSLLRLAMVAPRFFSDEQHPGRLLVERVAERSFKYNDEFSVEFQGFFRPVAQAFSRLNAVEKFEDGAAFEAALAALQAGWSAQDTLDDEGQRKVLDAVQFVERRQQQADCIAAELRQREDLAGAAQPVQDFLLGTWALVMAHARLAQPQGGIDPGGHLSVVTELLWSVKPEKTLHEPARAFELIPRVLLKLRDGLAMLGQAPHETDSFFQQLEALHRPVLKLRARQRHRDLVPPRPPQAEAVPRKASDQLWMAPEEMRAAGFDDTVPSDLVPLAAEAGSSAVACEEQDAAQVLAGLEPGCWVDLYSRQHWRRARMVWASANRTLFMFVSHGGQPHSMTRRSMQRLANERLLRRVEGEGVVPRALNKLAVQPPAARAA